MIAAFKFQPNNPATASPTDHPKSDKTTIWPNPKDRGADRALTCKFCSYVRQKLHGIARQDRY